jgi:alkylation response protein AidB-like acyl-CoA dehydrogenase
MSAPRIEPSAALERSEEDRALADVARQFVRGEGLLEHCRSLADCRRPAEEIRAALAQALLPLGWSELLVPERAGAPPMIRRAAIVLQELGRALNPTPLIGSLLGAYALWYYGEHSDDGMTAFALNLEVPGNDPFTFAGSGGRPGAIDGVASVCAADACRAERIVCEARDEAGQRVHALVAGDDLRPNALAEHHSLDLTRSYVALRLDAVPARLLTGAGGSDQATDADRLARELFCCAVVLYCAETLASLSRLYAGTLSYTRERVAFGRPVASYQAIKHRLANASLHVETACALLEHAVDEIETGRESAVSAVSAVKAYLSTISVDVAEECMQFHGAIGYTWEFDAHLYLRRVVTQRWLLGDPRWHQRAVYRARTGA